MVGGVQGARDWLDWHAAYDRPDSSLRRRLAVVQEQVRRALDDAPAGPVRVVSACAGQGRDLIDVLADHPRRAEVTARLVELDARNAGIAAEAVTAAGLADVEVRVGDAGRTDAYAGMVPADLVLLCGVFGNVTDDDIRATVRYARQLCATGGVVIWTRHRKPPDLVPTVCRWFAEEGFTLRWLSPPDAGFGVGVHRFDDHSESLDPGAQMFRFVDA